MAQRSVTNRTTLCTKPLSWLQLGLAFLGVALLSLATSVALEILRHDLTREAAWSIGAMAMFGVLVAVPLTHFVGRRRSRQYSFWQPFVGGVSFVLLQALGWTVWAITVLCGLYIVYVGAKSAAKGIIATVGVGGVLSQLFVLLSLHFFTISTTPESLQPLAVLQRERANSRGSAVELVSPQSALRLAPLLEAATPGRARRLTWRGVGLLGLALSMLSIVLAVVVESGNLSDSASASVFSIGASALLVAVPMTHFLGGLRKYGGAYSYQPFAGGTRFVTLQGFGWGLWVIAILASIFGYSFRSQGLRGSISFAGLVAVVAQALVLSSLRYFDRNMSSRLSINCFKERGVPAAGGVLLPRLVMVEEASPLKEEDRVSSTVSTRPLQLAAAPDSVARFTLRDWRHAGGALRTSLRRITFQSLFLDFQSFLVVASLFCFPLMGAALILVPLSLCFFIPDLFILVIPSITVYFLTMRHGPHVSGARNWDVVRYHRGFWSCFERYFSARLIPVGKLDPSALYLMGFHPHGVYPLTTFWATRGDFWRRHYPGVEVDVCSATVMFYAPLVRELALWAGGRDVSKASLRNALSKGRSVILVPGGQREMRVAKDDRGQFTIVTSHKGFIRQALFYGAALVPVFSFGECQVLKNIYAPNAQEWTTRMFGFGMPSWPHGRWYSPIPHPSPITVVVGEPIPVAKNENPPESLVDELHAQYYARLRALFEDHKAEAGFAKAQLVYI